MPGSKTGVASTPLDVSAAEPAKCHLLDLPPELRNYVYNLALVSPESAEVGRHHVFVAEPESVGYFIRLPPLLQVSRQIKSEADAIFFGMNTFRLSYDEHFTFLMYALAQADFGLTTPYFASIRTLEVETKSVIYTADMSHGVASCSIVGKHVTGRKCDDCEFFNDEYCAYAYLEKCSKAEKVIRHAGVTGDTGGRLKAFAFEIMVGMLL